MTNDNKLSEHEKLKEICDKIGYEYFYTPGVEGFYFNGFDNNNLDEYINDGEIFYSGDTFYKQVNDLVFGGYGDTIYNYTELDIREIIFTQEFMNKYKKYAWEFNDSYKYYDFLSDITLNLNNPVDYLYNLIKE